MNTQPSPSDADLSKYYDSGEYYSTKEATQGGVRKLGWLDRLRRYARRCCVKYYWGTQPQTMSTLDHAIATFGKNRFGWPPDSLTGSRMLDVGCGDGTFIQEANEVGWDAIGLETSSVAVANAKKLGIQVVQGELTDDCFESQSFDVIRIWSVLEHVRDPIATLNKAHNLLRPGGWLVVQVPNAKSTIAKLLGERWSGWDVPVHLTHFNKKSLELAATSTGFDMATVHNASTGTLSSSIAYGGSSAGRIIVVFVDKLIDAMGQGDCIVLFARRPLQ
tara:strand:- start:111 stop:938 length:828 start_codon:yes stop_codon:yes gene_type:complete